MGSFPSVKTTLILRFNFFPNKINNCPNFSPWTLDTFAPSPYGMSIKTWVLPTETFFAKIEARSCDSGSTRNNFSTLINLSSAGARPKEPPQTKHAPVLLTTFFNWETDRLTGAMDSTVSAVPAAEVIALEEVLGIITPADAHIETTMGVVLFPAMPPIECLSAIIL